MLWFKNMMVYRLTREIPLVAEEINAQLAANQFNPCGSQDKVAMGWVSPLGPQGDTLVHASQGQLLLCVRKEEKMLPATVIKQALEAKVHQLETEQQRRLKKTEKESLKDEIIHSLLPRAFSRYSQTWLWIDIAHQRIIVDSGSAKKAEDALALLRKSLGSLPVIPFTLQTPVEITLTEWVRSGNPSAGFTLLDEAELKATLEEGGVIRCKKQELVCDEIAHHIESGKRVTKLGLDWQERVQFLLNDDASVKRVKFSDTLREQNDDISREDADLRFDADFVLMTGELSALIDSLTESLGGEAEH
ncbi:recombination-associated protein RdgC [Rosenbergiella australiborealis]|uniref:Recombination-associated protein RdgC n=1 Tax=Rosenbergiella australiborealis TaxID=1544696 RepID=A0ABS5T6T4_9GAMM|nr:recombination-associated protein RdgC [Rosenbergiella australiborealis]MBT0728065.1 recombination-associated protein RdgC [Rosenbergiella australiborealis]